MKKKITKETNFKTNDWTLDTMTSRLLSQSEKRETEC